MYIRQISRVRKDGSRVRYLQLARKVRDPETGIPRDQVLCHLGREDELDGKQLRRLAQSLTRFLSPAERVEVETQRDGRQSDTDLRLQKCLSYGGSYVLDALWQRLGLPETFRQLLRERQYEVDVERLIFALVANRALDPQSKLAIESWVGRKTQIEGLDEVAVQQLYRAMDFLVEHDEAVQQRVFFAVAGLLNLEVDLLFFDTTSTYFEVESEDEEAAGLRRYGHSKDHRPDLPQVVIGLAVTRAGIPVRCWVLPGNTADGSTVETVQRDLAGWRLNRVVWVMDRGLNGESQRMALQRGGGHLIVGERLRDAQAANHEALSRPGRFAVVRDNLEVKAVEVVEGSLVRRFVVVRNPAQAERDRQRREQLVARLEEELRRLNDGRRRRGAKHSKAVCTLRSHPTMGRYVRELRNGQLKVNRTLLREEAKLDGKFLLSTTDPSLSAEDVALGYKQLFEVENAFRTLKTTLELRPIYHHLPDRIRAHVLLCWLALLLVRVIERETQQTWAQTRATLEAIHLAYLEGATGSTVLCSELPPAQRRILDALSLPPPKRIRHLRPPPAED
jgi:transposase